MKDHHTKIGFIGAGNMATGLVSGLIRCGYAPSNIYMSDIDSDRLLHLKSSYGIQIADNNQSLIEKVNIVLLAVKPQIMTRVIDEITVYDPEPKPLIISIAAGYSIETLARKLAGYPLIRAMPNTPAMVSSGATALFSLDCDKMQKSMAESIMRAVGVTIWVDNEEALDWITALSGSGPAYFYYLIEAMEKAVTDSGIDPEIIHTMAIQTALGAAKMLIETNLSAEVLRKQVSSPGGTTEKAVSVFDQKKLAKTVAEAILAAKNRAGEISKQLDGEG